MVVARYLRVNVAGLGKDAKTVPRTAMLDWISTTTWEAKDWRTLRFSVDEDNMIVGLPRDGSTSSCFHPSVFSLKSLPAGLMVF